MSTYAAIQGLLWESEVVQVYRSDPDNSFRCNSVGLNFFGDIYYSPTLAWMEKLMRETQDIASYLKNYVDDSTVATISAREVRMSVCRVGPIFKYLGLPKESCKSSMVGQKRGHQKGTKVHFI